MQREWVAVNGMKAKAERRREEKRLNEYGLPRDARDWTEEDWRDLHEALETVYRKIAARHKPKESRQ